MAENDNLLTFRCPEDLRKFIADRMASTGKGKTAVAVELLRLGASALSNDPGVQQPLYTVQQDSERDATLPLYAVKQDVQRCNEALTAEVSELRQRIEEMDSRLGKSKAWKKVANLPG